jgi:hypothetical protein
MTTKILVALSAAALLGSCSGEAAPAQNMVKELMKSTVDPQAQILWKAAGSYSDETGNHDLRPTTEEGWKAAQDAARAVAEAGRLMETAPYAEGRGEGWLAFTRGLTELAEKNEKAVADRLSDDELLALGGELYNVCKACHEAYPAAEPLPEE